MLFFIFHGSLSSVFYILLCFSIFYSTVSYRILFHTLCVSRNVHLPHSLTLIGIFPLQLLLCQCYCRVTFCSPFRGSSQRAFPLRPFISERNIFAQRCTHMCILLFPFHYYYSFHLLWLFSMMHLVSSLFSGSSSVVAISPLLLSSPYISYLLSWRTIHPCLFLRPLLN